MAHDEIETTILKHNEIAVPDEFARRHQIEPGQRAVLTDSGREGEFTVRVLRSSYAGTMPGVWGRSTEENVAIVRKMRDEWS